eukprot:Polyplicarium_translucidae@DN3326_c0_g1_i6.p1
MDRWGRDADPSGPATHDDDDVHHDDRRRYHPIDDRAFIGPRVGWDACESQCGRGSVFHVFCAVDQGSPKQTPLLGISAARSNWIPQAPVATLRVLTSTTDRRFSSYSNGSTSAGTACRQR